MIAVLLLAAIAFLVFQLAGGGGQRRDEQVTVPNFVGMDSATANQQATALGLTLTPTGQVASDHPEGQVLSQDPPAGTKVDTGTAVKVTVATGVRHGGRARPQEQERHRGTPGDLGCGADRRRPLRGVRPTGAPRPGRPPKPARRFGRGQGHAGRLRGLEGTRANAVADADAHTDADPHAGPADTDTRSRRRRHRVPPTPTRLRPRPSRRIGRAGAVVARSAPADASFGARTLRQPRWPLRSPGSRRSSDDRRPVSR